MGNCAFGFQRTDRLKLWLLHRQTTGNAITPVIHVDEVLHAHLLQLLLAGDNQNRPLGSDIPKAALRPPITVEYLYQLSTVYQRNDCFACFCCTVSPPQDALKFILVVTRSEHDVFHSTMTLLAKLQQKVRIHQTIFSNVVEAYLQNPLPLAAFPWVSPEGARQQDERDEEERMRRLEQMILDLNRVQSMAVSRRHDGSLVDKDEKFISLGDGRTATISMMQEMQAILKEYLEDLPPDQSVRWWFDGRKE